MRTTLVYFGLVDDPAAAETATPSRSSWREWADHMGAIVGLGSFFVLVASLLGHRPTDRGFAAIAMVYAGAAVLDGARLAWRRS